MSNSSSISNQIEACDAKFETQIQYIHSLFVKKGTFCNERQFMASMHMFHIELDSYVQCIDNIKKSESKRVNT
jgi:hypothetical protein